MKKTVFVQGNFDILHAGHLRLLKFAKECGDQLIVAVNQDKLMEVDSLINENERLDLIRSIECVDDAFLTDQSPVDNIRRLKPALVVKGREFEDRVNPELAAVQAYGGNLIFGSGEFESNSAHLLKRKTFTDSNFDFRDAKLYAQRHKIDKATVGQIICAFGNINVAVIGEVIVDEYVQGSAVGLSQEDPTIVMVPNKVSKYLGGAAITAGHVKSLGANRVDLYSVLGDDEQASYVQTRIADYQVIPYFVTDPSRPTPLKTRFRAGAKTLLRVNQVRQHKISRTLQEQIFAQLQARISEYDLLIFSDFNYGLLPQELVDRIIQLCQQHQVMMVADSQTSSQVGDISRFYGMDLLTPTEKEVRVALNNIDDGLVMLAQKLAEKCRPKYLVVTLAEEGVFMHKPIQNYQSWQNDRLAAININAVDPAGAGDCFLAASAMVLCAGGNIWLASFVASFAAACQVGTLGNTPLDSRLVEKLISESFS